MGSCWSCAGLCWSLPNSLFCAGFVLVSPGLCQILPVSLFCAGFGWSLLVSADFTVLCWSLLVSAGFVVLFWRKFRVPSPHTPNILSNSSWAYRNVCACIAFAPHHNFYTITMFPPPTPQTSYLTPVGLIAMCLHALRLHPTTILHHNKVIYCSGQHRFKYTYESCLTRLVLFCGLLILMFCMLQLF